MMKKLLSLIFASLIVVCGLSVVSFAQTGNRRHNINKRQENQQDRIAQGIKSGELNAREATRLEGREVRINQREAKYRESGNKLTQKERAKLEGSLNRESQNIYRQKHDAQGGNSNPYNINQRQQNQDKRIYNGIRSGELTPREAGRLENGDDRIERQEARFRKSGNGLSYRERYKLERELNHESRYIYKQKHDKQTYPKP